MSNPLPTYEVPPPADDEITVTVRIRVAAQDVAEHLAHDGPGLVAVVAAAVRPLYADNDDAHLAGIEMTLPTWKPYGRVLPHAAEEAQP